VIVVLHGIHTSAGDPAVPSLFPYLPGPHTWPDYGYILALETRRINPAVIGALLPYIGSQDVLVGHSNGCAIAFQVAQKVPVRGLVLIDAALRRNIVMPAWVEFCHVYFNAGDDITELAEFEADLPASPVDPMWGEMGHAGYSGTDPRVQNYDCGATAGLPAVSGHSDIFTPEKIKAWGPFIGQRLAEHGVGG
jgi:pimeloyl-ACP methyl ester carboxylesterase